MTSLYPFQEEAVQKALSAPGKRWIFNFQTGLGKSCTAIETMRRAGAKKILVVCPAIVRQTWVREIAKWWPEHPSVGSIFQSKTRTKGVSKRIMELVEQSYGADIQVVSYELVKNISRVQWDGIIIDEAHYLSNPASKQSAHVRELLKLVPSKAMILALSATLMPNDICNIWHILNLLWPNRFGQPDKLNRYVSWSFANRYSNRIVNSFGTTFKGINLRHQIEIKSRLEAVSSRATKKEVAHFLPRFSVATSYYSGDEHKTNVDAGTAWAITAVDSGSSRVVLFTHLRKTAIKLSEKIAEKLGNCFLIDGSVKTDDRLKIIDKWVARSDRMPSCLVATMHSVGIGINGLEAAQQAAFVELYARPSTILQAMGRFDRLSSKEPSSLTFLVRNGSRDEFMADVLVKKITAINQVVESGTTEVALEGLLTIEDDAKFIEDLLFTMSSFREVEQFDWEEEE